MKTLFDFQTEVYKTLANPKRLEIIHLIRDRELSVNEMSEMLGIRQANLSQHLGVLRENGIVKTRRNGVTIFYSLTDLKILESSDLIRDHLYEKFSDNPTLFPSGVDGYEECLLEHTDPVCHMRIRVKDASGRSEYRGEKILFLRPRMSG